MHGFLLIWPQFTMKTSTVIHGLPHFLDGLQILLRISSSVLFTLHLQHVIVHFPSKISERFLTYTFQFHILSQILNISLNTVILIYLCWQFKWGRALFPMYGQVLLYSKKMVAYSVSPLLIFFPFNYLVYTRIVTYIKENYSYPSLHENLPSCTIILLPQSNCSGNLLFLK